VRIRSAFSVVFRLVSLVC